MEKKTKKVRLHAKWRELQTGWRRGKDVPWLNVSGVWLQQAGFNVGDAVEITVENNMLIIKNIAINGDT